MSKYSLVIVNFLFSISVIILVWMCLVLVLFLFSNSKQMFSVLPKSNTENVSSVLLYRIVNWSYCSGSDAAAQTTDPIKHAIILYYYSIF